MTSDYYRKLDALHRERYLVKLNNGDLPDPLDPYLRDTLFVDDPTKYPEVSFGDIYFYLVEKECVYTREAFKSYKLTDGYNFFISGKVKKVLTFIPKGQQLCMLLADVEASQTNKKYYSPWIVCDRSGSVTSAHCTCMAGLGEACNHIAALLFAVEACVKEGLNKPSCTSVECMWKRAKKEVEPARIMNTEFQKPRFDRNPLSQITNPVQSTCQQTKVCNEEEFRNYRHDIKRSFPDAMINAMFTDSEETSSASELESQVEDQTSCKIPPTILELYKAAESLNVTLCSEEVAALEKATRLQHRCSTWHEQRKGRITASLLGRVANCRTGQEGIVASIMGYLEIQTSKSMKWGQDNELKAKTLFINATKKHHSGFEVLPCGLQVDPLRPYLGATPDGLVRCTCCEDHVLEIKCPESMKNISVKDAACKNTFFLDEKLQLKNAHPYFYQVQGQMALFGTQKAYFMVYTVSDYHICEIQHDPSFWNQVQQKIAKFYITYVLPEIKFGVIKKKMALVKSTCLCKGLKKGLISIVECKKCSRLFHSKCVSLNRKCKDWICAVCLMK